MVDEAVEQPVGGPNPSGERRRRGLKLRPWVRAIHRDLGYVAVGLTIVYALSGIAVNHVKDWDPNFTERRVEHVLGPLSGDDDAIVSVVVSRLGIEERADDVYRESDDLLQVTFEKRSLQITPSTGRVLDEGQEPRPLLRIANWLHLNRGKKAWTYVADAYAAGLLLLALSGLFMIPGRKGLIGRGAVLVLLGIAIPVVYVNWSGGP